MGMKKLYVRGIKMVFVVKVDMDDNEGGLVNVNNV